MGFAVRRCLPDIYRDAFNLLLRLHSLVLGKRPAETSGWMIPRAHRRTRHWRSHNPGKIITVSMSYVLLLMWPYSSMKERGPYCFTLNLWEILSLSWPILNPQTRMHALLPSSLEMLTLEPSQHIWRHPRWHMGLSILWEHTHLKYVKYCEWYLSIYMQDTEVQTNKRDSVLEKFTALKRKQAINK